MLPTPISIPPVITPLPQSAPLIQSLQIGTILDAVVINQTGTSETLLLIGNTPLRAQSSVPLQAGEALSLKVEEITPRPVLSIVTRESGETETVTIARTLRAVLPRQAPLPPLLSLLGAMAGPKMAGKTPLPAPLLKQVGELFQNLPEAQTLFKGEGLARAIQHSGLFLEARLANHNPSNPSTPTPVPALDLKGALLRLLQTTSQISSQSTATAKPSSMPPANGQVMSHTAEPKVELRAPITPPAAVFSGQDVEGDLQRLLEGAVARVQTNQLASLPTDEGTPRAWVVEIPVRQPPEGSVVKLRIQQETNGHEDSDLPYWSVNLSVEPPRLGPIHARISLGGEKISTTLWVEQASTLKLVQRHLGDLDNSLRKAGLATEPVCCHGGEPPDFANPPLTAASLVDIHA